MVKKAEPMSPADTHSCSVLFRSDHISLFLPLLQRGFQVSAKVGCDIQSLLCDQFKLMPEYLSDRISTVFLDGKPVDDVATAVVKDGATLALSAAMPGLVGATFRKSGCLAAFRGSITHRAEEDAPAACYDGHITLKLFNLLISELGPQFLKYGIWITGAAFNEFWQGQGPLLRSANVQITRNGSELKPDEIADLDWISQDQRVLLQASA